MCPADSYSHSGSRAGFTLVEAVLGLILMAFAGLMAAQSISSSRTRIFETETRILEDDAIRSCMNEIVTLYNYRKGGGVGNAATELAQYVDETNCQSCYLKPLSFSFSPMKLEQDSDGKYFLKFSSGLLVQVKVAKDGRSISRILSN